VPIFAAALHSSASVPPVTSWGVLLTEARNINVVALYPWLMLPVVPVILVVLAFNFLGDGLRDAADPYT
jgi:peptide/nickel transport system permease protein